MYSHVTVGATDIETLAAFYDAVLTPLGIARRWTDLPNRIVGWSIGEAHPHFFITGPFNGEPAAPGNGQMVAFLAPTRDAVHAVHQAALAMHGTDEGAPGLRPRYAPDYYGAYMRDPEGNKLHVVHRGG